MMRWAKSPYTTSPSATSPDPTWVSPPSSRIDQESHPDHQLFGLREIGGQYGNSNFFEQHEYFRREILAHTTPPKNNTSFRKKAGVWVVFFIIFLQRKNQPSSVVACKPVAICVYVFIHLHIVAYSSKKSTLINIHSYFLPNFPHFVFGCLLGPFSAFF